MIHGGMLQVEEAQALVMAEISLGVAESVPIADALGRVLREGIIAAHDSPAADNSAMDGYAVRAEDVDAAPVTLEVIGDIPAGHPTTAHLRPGTAMTIMTGAFVPAGADAVVQVELTDGRTDLVTLSRAVMRGANIRRRGEDMLAGDLILREGVRIGAAEMAVLAGAGRSTVMVGRRPTVAILSTGDELIEVGDAPAPGKIVNTNAHLLAALVREAGGIPRSLGIVRDTRDATIAAFEAALESDVVISSGGVSVGAYDFVKEALDALGAETKFWRVAMKPGKPVVFSRRGDRLLFGLPGNPASCFVSFHLFVRPALRKHSGEEGDCLLPVVRARVTTAIRAVADRRLFTRVHVVARDGELVATPLTAQSSGALTSMTGANALAVVTGDVAEGGEVMVMLLGSVS